MENKLSCSWDFKALKMLTEQDVNRTRAIEKNLDCVLFIRIFVE